MTFAATILTLYPAMFPGPLGHSLAGRALTEGAWSLDAINIRDFAADRHRTVDDTPAGGGAGMVLRADVLAGAIDHARTVLPSQAGEGDHAPDGGGVSFDAGAALGARIPLHRPKDGSPPRPAGEDSIGRPVIALTPRGVPLSQARVRELAQGPGVILVCGRFEGFDERIFAARDVEEISVGDVVLSGGEPAALLLLDACIRLLSGVMGAALSGAEESFDDDLLEYPHYTRPVDWEGRTIPQVLRSGDHAKIAAWRKARAEDDTRSRRPDLWERHVGARGQPASGARRKNEEPGS